MTQTIDLIRTNHKPTLIADGVAFSVITVDFTRHDCIISKEALRSLSHQQVGGFGPLEIFQVNEARIRGVARRLIAARVQGSPLQIEAHSFH
ncbi:MAG: hypothetical protein WBG17_06880 [Burkholderiaceae bacterium]